ncbi:hypothetical protein EDI_107920 [Entamoeba dispar SAW760]|uniref:Uncharacterized protein n=1 Tax=Entamoeba dispar (strain ATCC PRA-260 / SAW760) TaxID=370354 RepID=B0EPL7_ENTDS|nr:uncharacterized protein EDI_107920 [Entamoeba dispar SAW760]EDR23533.1 hypothetical protein EDI_107920 [Entamoeba dispar SAW760]|eukprot:EDR23533.1 hypothetical protein EDI_107920 [Entamoeba dispar SAW760]
MKRRAEMAYLKEHYPQIYFNFINRIKEITESLKHDNNQDLLDKLKIEINELKNKLKKLCGDAVTEVGKVIIQKVEDVSDVAVSIFDIYSLIQQFKIKDILDYMLTQNKITNYSQQGGNDNHPTNNTNKQNNSSKISLYNNNTPLGRTIKTINITQE